MQNDEILREQLEKDEETFAEDRDEEIRQETIVKKPIIDMDWNLKYRPKTFEDMVGQDDVVNYYRKYKLKNSKPKHAIFIGRAGIGKTSMAHVIKNEFGVRMMPINASSDRTLTYFRDYLIPKWRYLPLSGSFRYYYIDETENVLNEAWMVLKSPLEEYKNTTTVVFSCNNDRNIPPEIKSRCKVFNFKTVSKEDVVKRLEYIADEEKLKVADGVIDTISDKCKGDLRKAVMMFEDYSKEALQFGKNEFEDLFTVM